MANYELELGLTYQLSPAQSRILDRYDDTIVRALPGSGKTTLLTHKIKLLLRGNTSIKLCAISYTNVNVEDLLNDCEKILDEGELERIEFLTFHGFCQKYILEPFSYLVRRERGNRPSSTLFNFEFHGGMLVEYLTKKLNPSSSDFEQLSGDIHHIKNNKNIYYNFKHEKSDWIMVSNRLSIKTLNRYAGFLKNESLIDHNQTLLFSLLILEQNSHVKKAINHALDWIMIDEFQDVTEIQCEIIKLLRSERSNGNEGIKWFLVGDPNQSIYGFAGADPKSIFKMREFFCKWQDNYAQFEISLKKSYRCSIEVFNFAKRVYNENINRVIKALPGFDIEDHAEIRDYLSHLKLEEDMLGNEKPGIVRSSTPKIVEEGIAKIREELEENESVCCIGLAKHNSFSVFEFLSGQNSQFGQGYIHYSRMFLDQNKEFDEPLFRLFNAYLLYKSALKTKGIRLPNLLRRLRLQVKKYLWGQFGNIAENFDIDSVVVSSCDLGNELRQTTTAIEELSSFVQRLGRCVNELVLETIGINNNSTSHNRSRVLAFDKANAKLSIKDVLEILLPKKDLGLFEIKHVHKIKGLEFDKVILHGLHKLPYHTLAHVHSLVLGKPSKKPTEDELMEYIQDLNKMYVMLTRSKGDLYIVKDEKNLATILEI